MVLERITIALKACNIVIEWSTVRKNDITKFIGISICWSNVGEIEENRDAPIIVDSFMFHIHANENR
jgi:hypothetical protein